MSMKGKISNHKYFTFGFTEHLHGFKRNVGNYAGLFVFKSILITTCNECCSQETLSGHPFPFQLWPLLSGGLKELGKSHYNAVFLSFKIFNRTEWIHN